MIKENVKIEDRAEFVGQIIDIFEDFLEERGVMITNSEREESAEDNSAIIYGSDYGELSDSAVKPLALAMGI